MTSYDSRGYCFHLQQKEICQKSYLEPAYFEYICSLTNNRCVGAKRGFFRNTDDKIKIEIIERCPSRETLDQALNEGQ